MRNLRYSAFLTLVILFILWGRARLEAESKGLTFDDAARLAAANSLSLKSAYANRSLREGAWVLGRRAYLPKLTISAGETDRLSQNGSDSFLKNYTLTVEQLVWDGGNTYMSRQIERAGLNLLDKQIEQEALKISDAAVAGYRQILSARASLAIQEDTCRSLEEQRAILVREIELGIAIPLSLVEADITLGEARIGALSLRLELEEAERSLADLLGLEELPLLLEKVDVEREPVLPLPAKAAAAALGMNPDLEAARFSIAQRQTELRLAKHSWIPKIQLQGSAGLSGQHYPLSRANWSVGLSIEFSSPWLSGKAGGNTGWEAPGDRSAGLQTSLTPAPAPAEMLSVRQASLALSMEEEGYRDSLKQLGRSAESAVEKCGILNKKRRLALEAKVLEQERYKLAELKLSLGQITRAELMEARLDVAKSEISAVKSAADLLEAERELERLMGLRPGSLQAFSKENMQ